MKRTLLLTVSLLQIYGAICQTRGFPSFLTDSIIPTYAFTLRALIKDRETAKAQQKIIASKDTTIAALEEKARIADSLRLEFATQARINEARVANSAEKENIYKGMVADLQKDLRRARGGAWAIGGGAVVLSLLVLIFK